MKKLSCLFGFHNTIKVVQELDYLEFDKCINCPKIFNIKNTKPIPSELTVEEHNPAQYEENYK